MKQFFLCNILLFTTITISFAQDFITRGKIEFEVKRNTKHMLGSSNNGDNPFQSVLPEFDISYYDLLFSWNQSIYQPGRKGAVASMYVSEESVYMDLNTQ